MSRSTPRPAEHDKPARSAERRVRSSAEDEERRRRLAEALGDVLPDRTADEVPEGAERTRDDREEWLRGQVPPHHG